MADKDYSGHFSDNRGSDPFSFNSDSEGVRFDWGSKICSSRTSDSFRFKQSAKLGK